nr:MAG TPA: DNA-dependent RNA polymerase subunit [Caudoviricetes sp.]
MCSTFAAQYSCWSISISVFVQLCYKCGTDLAHEGYNLLIIGKTPV